MVGIPKPTSTEPKFKVRWVKRVFITYEKYANILNDIS